MSDYWKSVPGRVLTSSCGIALTGGGIATLVGHSTGTAIMCITLMLSVISGVFGVGLSVGASDRQGVWAVTLLPIAFFCYVLTLVVAVESHWTGVGFAFVAAGALVLARALLVKQETAQQGARKQVTAHAH